MFYCYYYSTIIYLFPFSAYDLLGSFLFFASAADTALLILNMITSIRRGAHDPATASTGAGTQGIAVVDRGRRHPYYLSCML